MAKNVDRYRLYSTDYVVARFTEMGAVLRTMPDKESRWLVRGWRATWPQVKSNPAEAYGYTETRPALVWPTTHQIDRCDECLAWLLWLDEGDRTIVLAKSCRAGSMQIARKLDIDRATVWRRHKRAIRKVTDRLNSLATGATPVAA